jgi:hypothetical protein
MNKENDMKKLKTGSLLLLLTAMLVPAWSVAQDDEGPQWVSVRTVTTAGGQGATWIEQQVQLAAAHKERGDPARHVWQEITGDLDTFHIVTFPESLGGQGGPNEDPPMGDGQEEWAAKIGPTVASRSTMLMRHFPDLSIPPAEGSELGFLVLRRTTVAPGRSGDYSDWLEDKLVPMLKKAGATGVRQNRVAHGGDTNLWISSSRIANIAALNGRGPLASLSEEERTALNEGLDGVIWLTERKILRYRASMSNSGPSED